MNAEYRLLVEHGCTFTVPNGWCIARVVDQCDGWATVVLERTK